MKLHTTLVIEHGLDGRTDRNVTGNVAKIFDGDAVEQAERLAELRLIFTEKFDRSELSPGMLQRVLWESNWWRAILPVVQRAADYLHLASASGITPGGLAAQCCAEIEAALTAMTCERIPETSIGDALLRGDPIPASDGVRHLGMEPPENGADAADSAGSTVGAEESPFAVYEFPHEMYAALRRVSEILGGIREVEKQTLEPTPDMLKAGVKVLGDVDELLCRIDGERGPDRPTDLTDKKMVDEAIRYRDEQDRKTKDGDRLARLERGLMALAKAIGPMATDQTLAAMEHPA